MEFSAGSVGQGSSIVTAVAWIQSLAWELSHASGADPPKKKDRERERERKKMKNGKQLVYPMESKNVIICNLTRTVILELCPHLLVNKDKYGLNGVYLAGMSRCKACKAAVPHLSSSGFSFGNLCLGLSFYSSSPPPPTSIVVSPSLRKNYLTPLSPSQKFYSGLEDNIY